MKSKYLVFILAILLLVLPASATLSGYNYSQQCNFTVSNTLNYQVKFDVYNGTGTSNGSVIYLNNHSSQWNNGLPNDIRFTDPSDNLLPYWIENVSPAVNTTHSIIWVNVTNTSLNTTVYYGNSTVTSNSSTVSGVVFPLFDHFDVVTVNSTLWYVNGSPSISGSIVTFTGSTTDTLLESKTRFNTTTTATRELGTTSHLGSTTYAEFLNGQIVSTGASFSWFFCHPTASHTPKWWIDPAGTGLTISGYTAGSYSLIENWRNTTVTFMQINNSSTLQYSSSNFPGAGTTYGIRPGQISTNVGSVSKADWVMVRSFNITEPAPNVWTAEQILVAPVASFTRNVTTIYAGESVQFNDTSTNSPTSWAWLFDLTNTSTSQNPVFANGKWFGNTSRYYAVNFTATNAAGSNSSNVSNSIYVYTITNDNALANVSNGTAPLTVQFNSSFTNGTQSANPLTYNWSFGDGNYSATRNTTHTFYTGGNYSIILNASSNYSYCWINPFYVNVTGPNPPVAAFHANATTGKVGDVFQFTDDSTGGAASSWQWQWGDGTANGTTKNPTHSYSSVGVYSVNMTATNGDGSNTTSKLNYITITTLPPPTANFYANTTSGYAPLNVSFIDLSTNTPTGWNWTFGDGHTSTAQNPTNLYANAGTYTVTLNASNAYGYNNYTISNYITVLSVPTPTPTPVPPGGNGTGGATTPFFPTTTYAGIHMDYATYMGSQNVSLAGNVSVPITVNATWFIIGLSSNHYAYYSTAIIPNAIGNFTMNVTGSPLMPGHTYYVRAACANGSSPEELNFTFPAISPSAYPTSNFGAYWQALMNGNKNDPVSMLMIIPQPYVDQFGGGAIGWGLFWLMLAGTMLMILFLRHDSLVIVWMVLALIVGVLIPMVPAEFAWMFYAFMVVVAGSFLYRFYKRE